MNARSLRNHLNPPKNVEKFSDFFKRLTNEDFKLLEEYMADNAVNLTFTILRIFEEQHSNTDGKFRLIYEIAGNQIDLTQIPEDLKSSHMFEDGWIKKFSKSDIPLFF